MASPRSVVGRAAPLCLDSAPAFFGLQSLLTGRFGRPRFPASLRPSCRLLNERDQPPERSFAVARLRAVFAAVDLQDTVGCQPVARQGNQPLLDLVRQRRGPYVESQFDGGRDLIHVLSARTGRANESLFDFVVREREGV